MGKTLGRVLSITAAIGAAIVFPQLALPATLLALKEGAGLLGLGGAASRPDAAETAIKAARPYRVSAYGYRRHYAAMVLQ